MKLKKALIVWSMAALAVLPGLVFQAEAITINKTITSEGNGFRCNLQFNYIPSKEDIGGIQLDIKTKQKYVPGEIIASVPEMGPWSQISPVFIRNDSMISLSAITASFLKSNLDDPVVMFNVQLTFSGDIPGTIHEVIDTIALKKTITTNGKDGVASLSWGVTSIHNSQLKTRPECNYSAQLNRIHQLTFSLEKEGTVKASVVDAKGKTVRVLLDSKLTAGIHSVAWDGSIKGNTIAASGIYFIQLETGSFTYNKKVSYLK